MPAISAPGLMTLLARGHHASGNPVSLEDWLCRAFIGNHAAPCPAASLTLLADGGNPGTGVWYRVDPVHLRIQRDELVLADNETLSITTEEAASLTDSLNSHFREDGLFFQSLHPNRWYVKFDRPLDMKTHSLSSVTGRNIESFLPHGPDGLRWHQVVNEIQMLLHQHPVNEAREHKDEMTINSVWLWGEGSLPSRFQAPYQRVWSNLPLAQGLAIASKTTWSALPGNIDDSINRDMPALSPNPSGGTTSHSTKPASGQVAGYPACGRGERGSAGEGNLSWLEAPMEGKHLLTLDQLRGAAQYGDYYGWQDTLVDMDKKWFTPLLAALRNGQISELVIHVTDCKKYHCFKITRSDLWKFWRTTKSIYQFD